MHQGMKNTGKPHEKHFDGYWLQFGKKASVIPFEDQADLVGRNRGRIVKSAPKPCDRLVTYNGQTTFVEVKSSGNKTSFPFANFQTTQIGFAIKITRAGGLYDVCITNTNTGHWYIVPWWEIEAVIDQGKKSIKWTDLERFRFRALETYK